MRGFETNKYKNVHMFAKDMRTMWDNAMKFNHPSEAIYKNAWEFLTKFEKRFKKEVLSLFPTQKLNENCMKVVRDLWKQPGCESFHDPLDYVKFGIMNYPQVIKNPSCLTKVRDRSVSFQSKKEFLDALDLVFNNAITYNGPETDIHQKARELKSRGHQLANLYFD